ncbi:hypothetical protein C0J45_16274 [Silurus meridionalis]|nr:hypothetical protein C0J45_16274 [Silurus meridionalis]
MEEFTGCRLEGNKHTTKEITAYTGDSVLLPCSCTDLHTKPQSFTWEKGIDKWEQISPESEQFKGRFQLVNDHSSGNLSLLISHLTVEDRGYYRCSTESDYRLFQLTVEGCRLNHERVDVTGYVGHSVLLPCFCSQLQDKQQTFRWSIYKRSNYKEIFPKKQTNRYTHRVQLFNDHHPGNLSLLISHLTVEDGADYRCRINNNYKDIHLTVNEAPKRPSPSTTTIQTTAKPDFESLPFVPFALVTVIFLHIIVAVVYCTTRKKDLSGDLATKGCATLLYPVPTLSQPRQGPGPLTLPPSVLQGTASSSELSPWSSPGIVVVPEILPPLEPSQGSPLALDIPEVSLERLILLRRFLAAWQALPDVSRWVLRTVERGYSIQFGSLLPHFHRVLLTLVGSQQVLVMEQKVDTLLRKGAIKVVPPSERESREASSIIIKRGVHHLSNCRPSGPTNHRLFVGGKGDPQVHLLLPVLLYKGLHPQGALGHPTTHKITGILSFSVPVPRPGETEPALSGFCGYHGRHGPTNSCVLSGPKGASQLSSCSGTSDDTIILNYTLCDPVEEEAAAEESHPKRPCHINYEAKAIEQDFRFLFGWDSDMSAILLLLHLLPPSAQGRKRPGKLSAFQAVDQLIRFQKDLTKPLNSNVTSEPTSDAVHEQNDSAVLYASINRPPKDTKAEEKLHITEGCRLEGNRETIKQITAYTGDSVLLPCSCTDLHTKPQRFTWEKETNTWVQISPESEQYKDRSQLTNHYTHRVQLFNDHPPGNLSLLISHLTVEDGGYYRCEVTNNNYKDIKLTVREAPKRPSPSTTTIQTTAKPDATPGLSVPHSGTLSRLSGGVVTAERRSNRSEWVGGHPQGVGYLVELSVSLGGLPKVSWWVLHTVEKGYANQVASSPSRFNRMCPNLVGPNQTRSVERPTSFVAHKLPEDDGGVFRVKTLPPGSNGPPCVGPVLGSCWSSEHWTLASTGRVNGGSWSSSLSAVASIGKVPRQSLAGSESLHYFPFAVVTVIFLHIIVAVVYCSTKKNGPNTIQYSRGDGDGTDTDPEDTHTKGMKKGVLTVVEDDVATIHLNPNDTGNLEELEEVIMAITVTPKLELLQAKNIGIVIDGVEVITGLGDIARACSVLLGLNYVLNLDYPRQLKYTFEVFQKPFLELDDSKLSNKVQSLMNKLQA